MKKIILGLFVFGLTIQSFAQIVELPEVEIVAVNYKYLNDVRETDAAQPVQLLQREVAAYDLKSSEYYEDQYEDYFISFYIPQGKILASYDREGNVLRTVEKYENIALPNAVAESVVKNYAGWTIAKNAYLVNYHDKKGVTKKEYKILLEKDSRRMRIKTDEKGNML
ncbi:MAG: nicotinate-nucleotide adenylyltransferase [Gillisia sp.]|nr:nicotinate-nucleotide adenylyltransferase [Gillisia sp.]